MAYSIRKEKVVKYRDEENKQPLVYFEFNCDEVADLPIGMTEEKEIAQGSIAWVISTGEFYDYTSTGSWRFFTNRLISAKGSTGICSHFVYIGASGVNDTDNIGFSLFNASQFGCRCPKSVANTVDEFKAWLANQYAAGTPITVWYILAEPETAVVNEPLRKIGDYADSISDVISIPTVRGKNVFDVDTEVKPSEVYIKYKNR